MTWNSFKDLADSVVSKKGIKKKIEESLVIESANSLIIKFLSDNAHDKIRAIYFKSGTLTIAALDDKLLKDLLHDKDLFLSSLNSKLGENIVDDLNILN